MSPEQMGALAFLMGCGGLLAIGGLIWSCIKYCRHPPMATRLPPPAREALNRRYADT